MELKNVLKWLLGLAVFYFSVLVLIAYSPNLKALLPNIDSTTGVGHTFLRFDELKTKTDIDVLFLGSSHTYRGFDTRIFKKYGMDSFNLGTSSQTPLNTYYLLNKYLEKISPNFIVFEVYWGTSVLGGKESAVDIASNSNINLENIIMAFATHDWGAINSTLALSIEQLIRGESYFSFDTNKLTKQSGYIEGGYVESTKKADIDDKTASKRYVTLLPKQVKYVEKIIKMVQEKDIDILLVRTPVSLELLKTIENYNQTIEPIEQIAQKYNIKFIDFNNDDLFGELNLTLSEDFYDKSHLNHYGVTKFNEYFAPMLLDELESSI